MSMRCMTVPPRMNPSGLASLGRTTWVITENESAGLLGVGVTPTSVTDSFRRQLPTPNSNSHGCTDAQANDQPGDPPRRAILVGSWELGMPWKLLVGSWEFDVAL